MLNFLHFLCTKNNSLPPSPPLFVFSLLCLSRLPPLQVAFSVKGGGEGHVVESPGDAVGPCVGRHASNAVLCLVRGKLPPQLLSCNEVLMENQDVTVNSVKITVSSKNIY